MGNADDRPGGLRIQAKAEVRRRIRDAATTLLDSKDFDAITTREVAKTAGIGEATLFRHVSSKNELLTIAYGDQMDALIDELITADDNAAREKLNADRILERIRTFYKGRASFYLRNPNNASRYLREAFDTESSDRERTMKQGDRIIQRVEQILAEGQRVGLISAIADPFLVAQNCHGIFIHEVDRTPTRGFEPASIWDRVSARLDAQLLVLFGSPPVTADLFQVKQAVDNMPASKGATAQ